MSRFAFKSVGRITALAASASLAFALSLSVSHQAMAASCAITNSGGISYTCSGDDQEIPNSINLSLTGATATNILVKILKNTELENEEALQASLSPTTASQSAAALWGIQLSAADNDPNSVEAFSFKNEGDIILTHNGTGALYGIGTSGDAGEDSYSVVNEGLISVTRGPLDIGSDTTTELKVSPQGSGFASVAANIAAGIYINEEETFQAQIVNTEDGRIEANGPLAYGIYARPTSFNLLNEGTISAGGFDSAAIVTWDGRANQNLDGGKTLFRTYGKSFIDNTGTIEGDIFVIDATRELVRRTNGNNFNTDVAALDIVRAVEEGNDPYLTQNPTVALERRDSEINNYGAIAGNIYLFSGSHVVTNGEGATIDGSVVVDQRRKISYAAPSSSVENFYVSVASRLSGGDDDDDDEGDDDDEFKLLSDKYYTSYEDLVADNPDHHFELDTAGIITGDVKVYTYAGATDATTPPSTIELRPHIIGSGVGSTEATPSENSGYIGGTLAIGTGTWPDITTSTIGTDAQVTLSPVIDYVVHNGESFLVARHLVGTALPDTEDTVLVDWTAYQVGGPADGHALAVQASVADASIVDGLSNPGVVTLNTLLSTDGSDDSLNELAVGVQRLTEEDDVRKAGEQLRPEVNFATQQAAITLNQVIGQHIDQRLASVGATGSSGNYAQPSGLGMGKNDPNRSSLGGPGMTVDPGAPGGGSALWGRAFGVGLNQDEIDNVDGYDTTIYGALAGYDNWLSPGLRVGVAVGYAHTNIDGKGATNQNGTDIDSYLAELYATYKGAGWYATGRTGYTWHDYETNRVLTVPIDDVAHGSHDGNQYNAAIEVGAPIRTYGAILTPVASLTYSNLDQDSYTERSEGGMALAIGDQQNDSLVSGLGLKALVPIANDTVLEGRALWLHEFSDTAQAVGASFAAGGATFTAAGPDVGRDSAALGLGLLASIGADSTFQLNYDANIRDDFIAHIGSGELRIRY